MDVIELISNHICYKKNFEAKLLAINLRADALKAKIQKCQIEKKRLMKKTTQRKIRIAMIAASVLKVRKLRSAWTLVRQYIIL